MTLPMTRAETCGLAEARARYLRTEEALRAFYLRVAGIDPLDATMRALLRIELDDLFAAEGFTVDTFRAAIEAHRAPRPGNRRP